MGKWQMATQLNIHSMIMDPFNPRCRLLAFHHRYRHSPDLTLASALHGTFQQTLYRTTFRTSQLDRLVGRCSKLGFGCSNQTWHINSLVHVKAAPQFCRPSLGGLLRGRSTNAMGKFAPSPTAEPVAQTALRSPLRLAQDCA
jgi:hypothetical protein